MVSTIHDKGSNPVMLWLGGSSAVQLWTDEPVRGVCPLRFSWTLAVPLAFCPLRLPLALFVLLSSF